jgi:hypothetical protein
MAVLVRLHRVPGPLKFAVDLVLLLAGLCPLTTGQKGSQILRHSLGVVARVFTTEGFRLLWKDFRWLAWLPFWWGWLGGWLLGRLASRTARGRAPRFRRGW